MRIGIDCHFSSKIKQGTNTYVSELVEAISRNDYLNKYFLLNAEFNNTYYKDTAKNLIRKHISSNSTRKNLLYGYRKAVKCCKLDILHTNYLSPLFVPCKTIVTIHDILYLSHPQYFPALHALQLKLLTPITIHFADRIIAVSEYTKKQIVSQFGVEEGKIGVSLEAASTDFQVMNNRMAIRKEIKEKYQIANDFVLYVGRFAPIKNIPRMLEALGEYNRRADLKMSFVLVGNFDPVYPDAEIETKIAKFKHEYQVHILRNVPIGDLVKIYNAARIFVFISYGEGFGLPILEAMACGTPVITSNVTSCPEIAGKAAITIDPHNDREIFEAMSRVLSSEELQRKMKHRGLKRAALFSWDRCCHETIKQYRLCLK